ncbi:MAG: winged helix-turn-helix domain-containing protein, partial [Gammaproteobacteria bacterium]|nr:winged helix-turn-helix domain-containing protein [Gammaproteobacteria bacterium]
MVENLEAGFTLVQWTVIPRQGVLRDDAGERRIEPKQMEVLVYLAEHAGDVVTRDELLENVWTGMVVGDEALSRVVSLLRNHLDDDTRQPIFIQTIPRRGYRLIPTPQQMASITAETPSETLIQEPARQSNWWRYLAGAAVMLVLGIVIWRATASFDTDPWLEAARTGRPINIAVFPLSKQGKIPEERAFVAESLADEIIVALSHIEDVRVARSSSRSVEEMADSLDLDAIIEGSVSWQLDRALITLHLTSARDGYQIWSQSFESDLADVFYVQDAISSAVVAELERSLGRKLRQRGPIRS